MTADQVIDLCKLWSKYSFAHAQAGGIELPAATVLAEHDWTAYVQAMTGMMPSSDNIVWPTPEDVNWAWPDGVKIVFSEPFDLDHTIISRHHDGVLGPMIKQEEPHLEPQKLRGLVIAAPRLHPVATPDGTSIGETYAYPLLWISDDPTDIVTGWWMPGTVMHALGEMKVIAESTRFIVSVLAALGHRLTRMEQPVCAGRGERRRVVRELPSLRVLQLSSGATVSRSEDAEHHKVEWTRRWMVRGHWRLQPYGPQRKLRKLKWIDPYPKGPEHLPLDVRPTVWRTGKQVPEGRL